MITLQALTPIGEAAAAAWPVVLATIVAYVAHAYFVAAKRGVPTIFWIPFDLYLGLVCLVYGTFFHPHGWILRAGFGFVGYFLASMASQRTTALLARRHAERDLRISRMFWRMSLAFRNEEPTESSWEAFEKDERAREDVVRGYGIDIPARVPIGARRRAAIFAKVDADAVREAKEVARRQQAGLDVGVDLEGHVVEPAQHVGRVISVPKTSSSEPKS